MQRFSAHLLPHEPGGNVTEFHLQILRVDTPEEIKKTSDLGGIDRVTAARDDVIGEGILDVRRSIGRRRRCLYRSVRTRSLHAIGSGWSRPGRDTETLPAGTCTDISCRSEWECCRCRSNTP